MALAQALFMDYGSADLSLTFVEKSSYFYIPTETGITVDIPIPSSAQAGDLLVITAIFDNTTLSWNSFDSNSNSSTVISSTASTFTVNGANYYLIYDGSATYVRVTQATSQSPDNRAGSLMVFRPSSSISTISIAGSVIDLAPSLNNSITLSGLSAVPSGSVRLVMAVGSSRVTGAGDINDVYYLNLTASASGWDLTENTTNEMQMGYLIEPEGTSWTTTTSSVPADENNHLLSLYALDIS